jgi:tetratricopeptide (TPR) repeat protein
LGWTALPACVSDRPRDVLTPADRQRAEACLREGDQARRDGDLDGAESAYQGALAVYPNMAEAYYQLGNIHLQRLRRDATLQEGEEAVKDYTAALRILPTFGKALYNRALAFHQLAERRWGDLYKLAAKDLQRLLEMNPRDADAHYFLAVIYDKHIEGMEAEAARHYQRYIELGGRQVDAQVRLVALAPFLKKDAAAPEGQKQDTAAPAPKPTPN